MQSSTSTFTFMFVCISLLQRSDHKSVLFPSKGSTRKASLPPCSGAESLVEMEHPFTDTSKLRVAHNVYLAVYAAAHALHSLLACPGQDSPPGKSNCSSPNHIRPIDVSRFAAHL